MSMVGLTARSHATETSSNKSNKEAVKYRDHPNNMQMCARCKFFISPERKAGSGMMGGPMMGQDRMGGMMGGQKARMMAAGTCQVVDGSIIPMGWCVLYQPTS